MLAGVRLERRLTDMAIVKAAKWGYLALAAAATVKTLFP